MSKIRISDVARACNTTKRAIRHWLDRYKLKSRRGGWLEFSLMEVMQLAVTRELVSNGLDVSHAFAISAKIVATSDEPSTNKIFIVKDGDLRIVGSEDSEMKVEKSGVFINLAVIFRQVNYALGQRNVADIH